MAGAKWEVQILRLRLAARKAPLRMTGEAISVLAPRGVWRAMLAATGERGRSGDRPYGMAGDHTGSPLRNGRASPPLRDGGRPHGVAPTGERGRSGDRPYGMAGDHTGSPLRNGRAATSSGAPRHLPGGLPACSRRGPHPALRATFPRGEGNGWAIGRSPLRDGGRCSPLRNGRAAHPPLRNAGDREIVAASSSPRHFDYCLMPDA